MHSGQSKYPKLVIIKTQNGTEEERRMAWSLYVFVSLSHQEKKEKFLNDNLPPANKTTGNPPLAPKLPESH